MTKSVSPQTVEMYMAHARDLRAQAIRSSFVEFGQAIKSLFSTANKAMTIPRTEQL